MHATVVVGHAGAGTNVAVAVCELGCVLMMRGCSENNTRTGGSGGYDANNGDEDEQQ